MNRLAILAVTGVLALMLTACGEEKSTTKSTETTTTVQSTDTGTPTPAPTATPENQ